MPLMANSPFPARQGEQSWGGTSRGVYLPTGMEGVASLPMPVPPKHTSLPSSLDCQLCRHGDDALSFNLNAYNSARYTQAEHLQEAGDDARAPEEGEPWRFCFHGVENQPWTTTRCWSRITKLKSKTRACNVSESISSQSWEVVRIR